MPFIWDWIWEKLNGIIKAPAQPESVDQAGVDDQVGKEVVGNGRKVSSKKSNTGAKPARIRSNNKSKTSRKSTGKAVRATTAKGKAKSKTVQKG